MRAQSPKLRFWCVCIYVFLNNRLSILALTIVSLLGDDSLSKNHMGKWQWFVIFWKLVCVCVCSAHACVCVQVRVWGHMCVCIWVHVCARVWICTHMCVQPRMCLNWFMWLLYQCSLCCVFLASWSNADSGITRLDSRQLAAGHLKFRFDTSRQTVTFNTIVIFFVARVPFNQLCLESGRQARRRWLYHPMSTSWPSGRESPQHRSGKDLCLQGPQRVYVV